jgi:hypothetical protein
MSRASITTKTMVATTRINQNRDASLAAIGPSELRIVGGLPEQAARSNEARSAAESNPPQRFAPRNIGILTSQSPQKSLIMMDKSALLEATFLPLYGPSVAGSPE